MMAFATDRMLMVLEPNLFRDVRFVGQILLSISDAFIAGTSLTTMAGDFDDAQIAAGQILLADTVPIEIVAVLSSTALTVSRLRPDESSDPIPPIGGLIQETEIISFGAQIGLIHAQLLRLFGIEVTDSTGEVQETNVVNVRAVALVEALGALHLVYSGASSLVGEPSGLDRKAALYRERYRVERERLVVQLDLDSDGLADASRVSNVLRLTRA